MEVHVRTESGLAGAFTVFPSDNVKTLKSILKNSFTPAAENQSGFHLFFQNVQLKQNNQIRDEIARIIQECKLEEPDQILLMFVPNPTYGNVECDKLDCRSVNTRFKYYRHGKLWKLRYFCRTCQNEFNVNEPLPPCPPTKRPPTPPVASSSSLLDLSDRVLEHCNALHQYNARLQMENSNLEKKNKALEEAMASLEMSHRLELDALKMERDTLKEERDDALRKFEAILQSYKRGNIPG